MAEQKTGTEKTRDVHKSDTFYGGVRALLSIGIYAGIGAVAGHYIGRWGEEIERDGRGMSTLLGRWLGGLTMGGLAAYISLRGAAEDEIKRDDLRQQNAELEARLKLLEQNLPQQRVHSVDAEHAGAIAQPSVEKAV